MKIFASQNSHKGYGQKFPIFEIYAIVRKYGDQQVWWKDRHFQQISAAFYNNKLMSCNVINFVINVMLKITTNLFLKAAAENI